MGTLTGIVSLVCYGVSIALGSEVVRLFVEANPHRTIEAARYQIDRNLSKRSS